MKFTSSVLYVDNNFPTVATFRALMEKKSSYYHKKKYIYALDMDFIEDKFFWMYVQYENKKLYNDRVFDVEDETEKENPKPQNYVEFRQQLFVCYDFEKIFCIYRIIIKDVLFQNT